MKKLSLLKTMLLTAVLLFGSVSMTAQTRIAWWEFRGLANTGENAFGAQGFMPIQQDENLTVGGLTRHWTPSGGTPAAHGWGGNNFATAVNSLDAAITAGQFITFTFTANIGYELSLSSIGAYNVRRVANGPSTGQWQYAVGTGDFTNIGSPITWGTVTDAQGNPQAAIDLSGFNELQEVAAGTTVTLRLALWGSSAPTGTFYFNDAATAVANRPGLPIYGTVTSTATHTVTFSAGVGSVSEASLTESAPGAGIVLPLPTFICDGWEFAGWTKGGYVSETTTIPTTLLLAGTTYFPTSDVDLYAVYVKNTTTTVALTQAEISAAPNTPTGPIVFEQRTIGDWSGLLRVDGDLIVLNSSEGTAGGNPDGHILSPVFNETINSITVHTIGTANANRTLHIIDDADGTTVIGNTTFFGETNVRRANVFTDNLEGVIQFRVRNGSNLNQNLSITGVEVNFGGEIIFDSNPVCPTFTVTLDAGTGEVSQDIFADVTNVNLPTPTISCGNWIFAGWATSPVSDTHLPPAFVATSPFIPTSDVTLYAVYMLSSGKAKTESLTNAQIAAATHIGGGYADHTIVGEWTGRVLRNETDGQFNLHISSTASGTPHILSPAFGGIVSSITVHYDLTGQPGRRIRVMDTDEVEIVFADVSSPPAIGYYTFTDFSGRMFNRFRIHSGTTMLRVAGVDVEFVEMTFNSTPKCVPTIIVAETARDFTLSAQPGNTATQTITVSGVHLTDDITLAITGEHDDLFEVCVDYIEHQDGEVSETTITITYTRPAENGSRALALRAGDGTHTATLTLSSLGAENIVFTLSGIDPGIPSNVPEVTPDAFAPFAVDGQVHFMAVSGEVVEIFNTTGQLIYRGIAIEGLNSIAVRSGIALLRVGGTVNKLIVR